MHRLIVNSATYRRSSAYRRDLATVDPDNVLLARQNALRVPAETVRDSALSVSGLLCSKMGGPGVKPPQPARVTMEAFGSNDWKPSPAPDRYRRGLYTFVIRTSPFAQSITFDAPNPNEVCTRRVRSNTPLQALTLLNDPVFFEMAQAMSERVLSECAGDDSQRVDYACRLALARPPTPAERKRANRFLQDQRERFKFDRDAAVVIAGTDGVADAGAIERAAWITFCSVLLNLHEFITRD